MRVWIDIENAPQVQYLAPFERVLREQGHDVVVTARDQDVTIDLLGQRGIEPRVVGSNSGATTVRKLVGLTVRAARLAAMSWRSRPDFVIAASRSSDLAAWSRRIPSFQFTDYEFADDRISRFTGTYLLYPELIGEQPFLDKGLRRDRLVPFPGLKEAISFAGLDLATIEPHPFPTLDGRGLTKVLFRAPGEATHYFVEESRTLALELLGRLAALDHVAVVYAPRYPDQVAYLDRFTWTNEPVVLRRGIPFIELLKAVDVVISSGGTMLREAAYLGLPAYSILRSGIGRVDRHLESLGRMTVLESADDLPLLRPGEGRREPLSSDPDLPATILEMMLRRVRGRP